DPIGAIASLGRFMVQARQRVAARGSSPADARRLIDLSLTAEADLLRRGGALLESRTALTAKTSLQLLGALTDATYGVGLLGKRELDATGTALRELLASASQSRTEFTSKLQEVERIMEWAQANALLPFAEVLRQ